MKFKLMMTQPQHDETGHTFALSSKTMMLTAACRNYRIQDYAFFAVKDDDIFRFSANFSPSDPTYTVNNALRIAGTLGSEGNLAFKIPERSHKIVPDFAVLLLTYNTGQIAHIADLIVFSYKHSSCRKQRIHTIDDVSATAFIMEFVNDLTERTKQLPKCISETVTAEKKTIEAEPIIITIEGEEDDHAWDS